MARGVDIIYIVHTRGGVPSFITRSCSKACEFAVNWVENRTGRVAFKTYSNFTKNIRKLRKGEITQLGVKSREGNVFAYVKRYNTNTDYSERD